MVETILLDDALKPDWLPRGALAHASPLTGRYWGANAAAEVGDFISDPTRVEIGVGLKLRQGDDPLQYLGALRDSLLEDNVTVVIDYDFFGWDGSEGGRTCTMVVNNEEDSVELANIQAANNEVSVSSYDNDTGGSSCTAEADAATSYRVAVNYSRTACAASVSGSAVDSGTGDPLVGAVTQVILGGVYGPEDNVDEFANIRAITVYAHGADDSLPSASAMAFGPRSAANRKVGTDSNDVVAFDGLGRYPAGNGQFLTNLPDQLNEVAGVFVTADSTVTVVNGLITSITPL
jgi:hypothetical protein